MKAITVVVLAGLPALSWAASTAPDKSFIVDAAQAGLAEISAGTLAQQKGTTQAVKDFGAMMVKDHTEANSKLEAVAQSEQVTLPTKPSVAQRAEAKALKMHSGANFDKDYLDNQVKDHEKVEAMLQKEISSGQDPASQDRARKALPTVQMHLMKAKELAAAAGVNP